jgi:hypothetical protein
MSRSFGDLSGLRFGKLIVLERIENNKQDRPQYKCKCDCGNLTAVSSYNLMNDKTKSCGCLFSDKYKNVIDLTGQRFSRWLVLKLDKIEAPKGAFWICQCDCGNIKSVRTMSLRNGSSQSCGCLHRDRVIEVGKSKLINLVGMKFGRLTVIERTDKPKTVNSERHEAYWLCVCECGKNTVVKGAALRQGLIKSCGCLLKEVSSEIGKTYGGNSFRDLTGLKFGRLLVIKLNYIGKNHHAYWDCLCDCGKTTISNTNSLNSGHAQSCGCQRAESLIKDIAGERFGRLLVIELDRMEEDRGAYWKCLCDCGKEIVTSGHSLRSGGTQSCGCLRRDSMPRGVDHHNWKGGITSENRKIRTSAEYRNWRKLVLKRDNYTCRECGATDKELSAHHIKSFVDFPEDRFDINNGITLCLDCHKETNNYGGSATRTDLRDYGLFHALDKNNN